jgi:hypothetical protein
MHRSYNRFIHTQRRREIGPPFYHNSNNNPASVVTLSPIPINLVATYDAHGLCSSSLNSSAPSVFARPAGVLDKSELRAGSVDVSVEVEWKVKDYEFSINCVFMSPY